LVVPQQGWVGSPQATHWLTVDWQVVPDCVQRLPVQQRPSTPPQVPQAPSEQIEADIPVQVLPAATQIDDIPLVTQHPPSLQTLPAQQASLAAPHEVHVYVPPAPAEHFVLLAVHALPAQHESPTPPHVAQAPLEQAPPPHAAGQPAPSAMQVPPMQQPPLLHALPAQQT
jgi:hypothetical protein